MNIKIGAKYKHFKGGEYQIHSIGKFADDNDDVVIYESLTHGGIWVRRLSEFTDQVDRPEYNYSGPRFVEIVVKPGDQIQLLKMEDDPSPILPGTLGQVISVKKFSGFEKLEVNWENGRKLAVIIPPDEIKIVNTSPGTIISA